MLSKKDQLNPLLDLLKIKSVSTQDKYLSEMKMARKYLVNLFGSIGFKTEIIKANKHNSVFASKTVNPKAPTVLVYGHYDVQPPEPLDQWKTPPFKPAVKNNILYARGASDDKGQLMIHIMALKSLIDNNSRLNTNFKFIIEGEEEIGSISIEDISKKHKKDLSADYLIVSDSQMPSKDQPSIDVSLRGLVYTEISIETAAGDVHSGQFGGVAENPAIILCKIISKLKDSKGKVLIPGFYNQVKNPTTSDLRDYCSSQINRGKLLKDGKLKLIGGGEQNLSLIERLWTRPTLDVNGIVSGYIEPGSKTIIPGKASAKISMRLVRNQDPDQIFCLFEKYIKNITPKGINVDIVKHASALPYKAPTNNPIFEHAKESLKKGFNKNPVFTGVGGSIGFVPIVAKRLNIPCIMIGFGLPDDNIHAPNEHFYLENYFKGIKSMTYFYQNLDKK